MNKNNNHTSSVGLRNYAEDRLKFKKVDGGFDQEDFDELRLLHELQVHQIELEKQNEELHRANDELRESEELNRNILDSLMSHIAVIDEHGMIVAVNKAWAVFADQNNTIAPDVGTNYLDVCRRAVAGNDQDAVQALAGLEDVLGGKQQHFTLEYPCHSPNSQQWFLMTIAPSHVNGKGGAVINHIDITERKKTEEALRENDERLRRIAHACRIGLYEWNTSRDNPHWSPETFMLFGCEESTSPSFDVWLSCVHPADREQALLNLNETIAQTHTGQPVESRRDEYRVMHRDGTVLWLEATTTFDLEKGDLVIRGVIRDITERKQYETALQKSRNFHAETEKIGKVGGWEFDITTKEQLWTEEVYRIHEVDMDFKPSVKNGIDFYTPASQPIIEKLVQRAITYAEPFNVDLEIITAKGNLCSVNAIGKADLENNRIYGFFQDITERKQAEVLIKNSEERYRQLFEMESDALLMIDIESSHIMDFNNTALSLYGYTNDEFMQLKPGDLSAEPSISETAIRNGETRVPLRMHRKKDGTVFPVEITASNFDYLGRKVHVAAIRDITERVRAKKQLIDLNQNLHDLNAHLQTAIEQERLAISRDIHDDLGQTLTVMNLDLEWLENEIPAGRDDLRQRINEMHESIRQVSDTIQRIAANLRPPLLDSVGLTAAIDWHVDEFRKHSGLECYVMLNENVEPLDAEKSTVVMRIVQEGLTNVARHACATEVSVSLCKRDDNLLLEISDNGCGITPVQIESPQAYGLMGMRERARICSGELIISGVPKLGTILKLLIPLTTGECAE